MGNITTDFVTATKKIHSDVCHILTELKVLGRDVKAIREQGHPKSDQPESSESHPSDSALPPSGKKHKTYEAKQYALERLRFRIEKRAFSIGKWTAIILAIYTGFTVLMYFATKKAAEAAKIAADTAQKTLVITNRSWIEMVLPPPFDQPLTTNKARDNLKYLSFPLVYTNIGKYPLKRLAIMATAEVLNSNEYTKFTYGEPGWIHTNATQNILYPGRSNQVSANIWMKDSTPGNPRMKLHQLPRI